MEVFFSKVDGQLVKINIGDTLPKDVQIESATTNNEESKLNLELENGELITITKDTNLEDFLLANSKGILDNPNQNDITTLETASGDLTEDETEAGEEEAADDGAFRGTFNDRDGDATDIVSDLRDASFVENRVLDENDELDVIALEDAEPIIHEVPIEPEIPEEPELPEVPATPIIKISGNIVIEEVEGNSTNKQVIGTITAEITNGVTSTEDIVISLVPRSNKRGF